MRMFLVLFLCGFAMTFACEPAKVTTDGQTKDASTQDSTADTNKGDTSTGDVTKPDTVPDNTTVNETSTDTSGGDTVTADTPKDGGNTDNVTNDTTATDTPAEAGPEEATGGDTTTQDTTTDNPGTKTMSFFITSAGPGDGANLGGLAGADAHCKKLAEAAGVMGKTWRAYLSTSTVNAKDRIGTGPWYNAKGVMVAKDVADLHSANNNVTKQSALDEKGNVVNGRGDTPNRHDILTGSKADGTVNTGKTCSDWTTNASTGSATVGHHDRQGGGADPTSWNSAHDSRGCSQSNLVSTGGDGLFYCFAE